jgi:hypothetical protein
MILFVLFSVYCRSALPLPDATEQERDLYFEAIRLPLRIVLPFLRIDGLRIFSFLRMAAPVLPSTTPPNLTSLGSSGH